MSGEGAGAPGQELYLGPARGSWRGFPRAAWRLARAPRAVLAIARARLTGRRLRARQMLAALIGIDHRLALPARFRDALGVPWRGAGPTPGGSTSPAGGGEDDLDGGILLLGEGVLVAGARARIAATFAANPDVMALYGDALLQERGGGPMLPLLPPAFDPDLLAAVDYIGLLAVRRSALDPPEPAGAVDAAFRIADRHGPSAIGHHAGILSIRREGVAAGGSRAWTGAGAALRAHLDRVGSGDARIAVAPDGTIRVLHPLPAEPPLASVIVPTRDRLDLLRRCLDSLRDHTDWPALEVLVCDNDSLEAETLSYLAALEGQGRAAVVRYPGPFNFAAMNNAAAGLARGRLLVFMNNDVEAYRSDWLALMAREALRPDVGAVGAKLIDGAGRIQHAGIVLGTGGGLVTHAHRHFAGDAPGYLGLLRATHAVSAVTAACLVVEADKFRAVGGFDAARFAVDFNDVDLCLRLAEAGHRTLMVPGAVLHHREAASRRWTAEAGARHAAEIAALKTRWGPLLAQDPHYHPGFDPDHSTHARLRADFPVPGRLRRPRS